ncbi:MAG: hypothetical protein QOH26_260 [Actinomycetota bacterium]|jgi:hypothetical protein|nr:hypothetical protein [Actinomycetota bacterium]
MSGNRRVTMPPRLRTEAAATRALFARTMTETFLVERATPTAPTFVPAEAAEVATATIDVATTSLKKVREKVTLVPSCPPRSHQGVVFLILEA